MKKKTTGKITKEIEPSKPACGLCGKKTKHREQTECCGNWICSDENDYVLFSYARNSCSRNHRRMTLCGFHCTEGHKGDWKTCKKCFDDFEPEMAAWYGTNEYNFEKIPNPPKFEPTKCAGCGKVISLSSDGHTSFGSLYACMQCEAEGFDLREVKEKKKK